MEDSMTTCAQFSGHRRDDALDATTSISSKGRHDYWLSRRSRRSTTSSLTTVMMLLTVVITVNMATLANAFINAFTGKLRRRRRSHHCHHATTTATTTLRDDILYERHAVATAATAPPSLSLAASHPTSTTVKVTTSSNYVQFVSPLLEDGYPPAVLYHESQQYHKLKPILLYLPGIDGTILAPFLQFPSLGEEFDVRAMKINSDDRSTFTELKGAIVEYLLRECKARKKRIWRRSVDNDCSDVGKHVFLMGESFGGILSTEVALELNRPVYREYIDLKGLVLVNPATSYLRSIVYELAPSVATAKPLIPIFEEAEFAFKVMTQLVPLFLNESRFLQQLIGISTFKGLPPVVNDAQREAYMGRVAFAIPSRIKFLDKETFQWRLSEWMEHGCNVFEDRLKSLQAARKNVNDTKCTAEIDTDTQTMLKVSEELRTTIIVGELDAMPSLEEAQRLSSELFRNANVHVVKGAGHISTCGASLHLIELLREAFPEITSNDDGRRSNHYRRKGNSSEELYGLEPRYDNAPIGMMPWLYWSKDYYKQASQNY